MPRNAAQLVHRQPVPALVARAGVPSAPPARHVDQVLLVLVAEEALAQLGQSVLSALQGAHELLLPVAQQDVVVGPLADEGLVVVKVLAGVVVLARPGQLPVRAREPGAAVCDPVCCRCLAQLAILFLRAQFFLPGRAFSPGIRARMAGENSLFRTVLDMLWQLWGCVQTGYAVRAFSRRLRADELVQTHVVPGNLPGEFSPCHCLRRRSRSSAHRAASWWACGRRPASLPPLSGSNDVVANVLSSAHKAPRHPGTCRPPPCKGTPAELTRVCGGTHREPECGCCCGRWERRCSS